MTDPERCPACGEPKADHLGPSSPPLTRGDLGATEDRPGSCLTKRGEVEHRRAQRPPICECVRRTFTMDACPAHGPFATASRRVELEAEVERLRKALCHYQFGPRGWAARTALADGDVGIDPETSDQAAGGPFRWERADDQRLQEALSALQWIAANADVTSDFPNQFIRLRQIHERAAQALEDDRALAAEGTHDA